MSVVNPQCNDCGNDKCFLLENLFPIIFSDGKGAFASDYYCHNCAQRRTQEMTNYILFKWYSLYLDLALRNESPWPKKPTKKEINDLWKKMCNEIEEAKR